MDGGNQISEGFVFQANTPTSYVLIGYEGNAPTELVLPTTHLGKPVTGIGAHCFQKHSEIEKIVIPENYRTIRSFAFFHCKGLKELVIGKDVELIERGILGCAHHFEKFTLDPENKAFQILNGSLVGEDGKTLIACPPATRGDYLIPAGIEKIAAQAFWLAGDLHGVICPAGLYSIGETAFSGCNKLFRFYLPQSVKAIHRYAFEGCHHLAAVFYEGDETDMEAIVIGEGNDALKNALLSYSESAPEHAERSWHRLDGVITPYSPSLRQQVKPFPEQTNTIGDAH
jgi:hypothetical protein